MEKINEKIINLKKEECLIIKIDNYICKKIEKLMMKDSALENLFRTCLVENNDVVNKINVEKSLELYCKNRIEYEELINKTLNDYAGYGMYEYIKSKCAWYIDFGLSTLRITKR